MKNCTNLNFSYVTPNFDTLFEFFGHYGIIHIIYILS